MVDLPDPLPGNGDILIRVAACGVCHTELDEIEGRMPPPGFPIIPGHQVVGFVEKIGRNAKIFRMGDRVSASAGFISPAAPAASAGKEMRTSVKDSWPPGAMPMGVMPNT
jgi:D-arabinose 1-dehydrogenase-like Zn-dependent alcohol dehydrogenase